ncbi:hypothetical protein LCL98_15385 [Rossellomorea aquimaris]|nr:hypothetical protein [Rossellomorea aquimaris]
MIEYNSIIFEGKPRYENSETEKYLLVNEGESEDNTKWKVLTKGWDYNLWCEIGERAGRAEAREITIPGSTISIENYISKYKKLIKKPIGISKLFDLFTIFIVIEEEHKDFKYYKDDVEKYGFTKDSTTYRQEVRREEEYLLIIFPVSAIRLFIKEDQPLNVLIDQPIEHTDQLSLF